MRVCADTLQEAFASQNVTRLHRPTGSRWDPSGTLRYFPNYKPSDGLSSWSISDGEFSSSVPVQQAFPILDGEGGNLVF